MKISRDVKFIENSFEILNGTYKPDSMIDSILSKLEFPIVYSNTTSESDSPTLPVQSGQSISDATTLPVQNEQPISDVTTSPVQSPVQQQLNVTSNSTLQRVPPQESLNPVQEHMHEKSPESMNNRVICSTPLSSNTEVESAPLPAIQEEDEQECVEIQMPEVRARTPAVFNDSNDVSVSIDSNSTPLQQRKVSSTVKPSVSIPTGLDRFKLTYTPSRTLRSGRVTKEKYTTHLFLQDDHLRHIICAMISGQNEPQTYKQAMKSIDAVKWKKAIDDEVDSLTKLGVWKTMACPPGVKPIKSRWVFKIKLDSMNQPVRYKARLVAKGFQQQYGIDYNETFAPVVKLKSIKMVLALAAAMDLELKQLDFDTAFLNATLNEDVYMELPDGVTNHPPGTVCKLIKALYGLKQAPHDWNLDIHKYLIDELDYEQLECDKCIYMKSTSKGLILLCLYVDDTVIAYPKAIESIWLADKAKIAKKYSIKDIGDCDWILNMKVNRDRANRTITLSQEAYIKKVLENFNHAECRSLTNPCIDADLYLPPAGSDQTPSTSDRQTLYQSIIGSLLYAALTTRPDIAFAVSELSRFNSQATEFHLQAAYHTLRYLAGTTNQGLLFQSNGFSPDNPTTEIYVDASWVMI